MLLLYGLIMLSINGNDDSDFAATLTKGQRQFSDLFSDADYP